jgi:hypothetical protein
MVRTGGAMCPFTYSLNRRSLYAKMLYHQQINDQQILWKKLRYYKVPFQI